MCTAILGVDPMAGGSYGTLVVGSTEAGSILFAFSYSGMGMDGRNLSLCNSHQKVLSFGCFGANSLLNLTVTPP